MTDATATPRTDAAEFSIPDDSLVVGRRWQVVHSHIFRDLERELSAQAAKLEQARELLLEWTDRMPGDNWFERVHAFLHLRSET